jgi:NADPH:quinone reductase-like Zn-dependent oxidoreductase
MVVRNYTAVGVSASLPMDAANAMAYDELIGMADRGEIRPRIGRVFRFDDLPEILDLLENGAPPGKLIMRAMN